MKKVLIGLVILVACSLPLFAQGSFSDVPTDHWAYDAVNKLQQDGIVIGYPDGTFQGKRALTRYEFAAAIARMIPVLEERIAAKVSGGTGAQGPQGETGPQGPEGPQGPAGPQGPQGEGINPADFQALQRLVNEFKDELASMGVDVDALKRDVAALAARVDILEKRARMFQWGLDMSMFGVATSHDTGAPIDRDDRALQAPGNGTGDLINSVNVVRDADLTLTSSVNPSFSAFADINFGNYLPAYLGGIVTDYVGTVLQRERGVAVRNPGPGFSGTDAFFPYYMYAEAGFGAGSLRVGRIPVQMSPYIMKLIDVDSYTVNSKTDSGNYPLDGGSLSWRMGPVNFTGFAAKTDQNQVLGNGLVSQPTAGLYRTFGTFYTNAAGTNLGLGHAIGGLPETTQTAGARISMGTPFKGALGVSYLQAVALPTAAYDKAEVWGGDLNMQIGNFPIGLEYAQSTTTDDVGGVLPDIDDNNTAMDGKVGLSLGKLGLDLGWRQIENNYGAPGFWGKIGRWTNPTNIEGPYANLTYGISPSISFVANGQFYKGANDVAGLPGVINTGDDDVWKAEGGLKWGFAGSSNLNVGIEYVKWEPDGSASTTEQYFNIGLAHQLNPNTGISVSYQIIDYKPDSGASVTPYGAAAYKGGVAVAQIKSKF